MESRLDWLFADLVERALFRLEGLGLGMVLCMFIGAGLVLGCEAWGWVGIDEPESLILAQSERWRHA